MAFSRTVSPLFKSLVINGTKTYPKPSTTVRYNASASNNHKTPTVVGQKQVVDIWRPPTMDDLMEPYGSWKVAYAAEKKYANKLLALGVIFLSSTLTIFYHSGVMDGLFMPNLDNLMEDTEPWDFGDKEGRITV